MLAEMLAKLMSVKDVPEPPPSEPMSLLVKWMEEAKASGAYADPWAMTVATATRDGVPSARVVLCKDVDVARGGVVFFTNYASQKGRELAENPRAAAVFHWPHAKRQARVEGLVEKVSRAESEAYFATRPLLSRIGACVSRQSEMIHSRAELMERAMRLAGEVAIGKPIACPQEWGGYRIIAHGVELWSASEGRLHQRVRWERMEEGAAWEVRWLSP